jgi:hypothetical protein
VIRVLLLELLPRWVRAHARQGSRGLWERNQNPASCASARVL